MPLTNVTTITDFIIVGFPSLEPKYYGFVGLLLFLLYLGIVLGNGFVLIIVATEKHLQKPTYVIFCLLAMSDLILCSTTLPKIIIRYWAEDKTISFHFCFIQMFVVHFYGAFYSSILLTMTLDRYIAIHNPLRYHNIITTSTVTILSGIAVTIGTVRMVTLLVTSVKLPYCNSNEILQCFCDHTSITRLACENTVEVQFIAFGFSMFVLIAPLALILFSYASIFITVMRIASTERRHKVFSTFTSQIIIVCLYYISRCFAHISNIVSFKFSIDGRIAVILLYTFIPPMLNPLIYCFWTTDIKETVMKKLKYKKAESFANK